MEVNILAFIATALFILVPIILVPTALFILVPTAFLLIIDVKKVSQSD